MVNPLEIMPVLALAALIVCIPILADPPELRPARRKVAPRKGATVPLIALRVSHRD